MTGLRFRETMTGRVAVRTSDPAAGFASAGAVTATMRAEVQIADVADFISNDVHEARLRAELDIPVLGIKALSDDGTFVLFRRGVGPDRRPARLMVYTARFVDGDHVYELSGRKILQPTRHPWGDSTTAHVTLVEVTDGRTPLRAAGFVRISPWRFLRQLLTMRGFGAGTAGRDRRRAVLDYAVFFGKGLAKTYVGRARW